MAYEVMVRRHRNAIHVRAAEGYRIITKISQTRAPIVSTLKFNLHKDYNPFDATLGQVWIENNSK